MFLLSVFYEIIIISHSLRHTRSSLFLSFSFRATHFWTTFLSAKPVDDFPTCGYMRDASGTLITKHNKEVNERKNTDKVLVRSCCLHGYFFFYFSFFIFFVLSWSAWFFWQTLYIILGVPVFMHRVCGFKSRLWKGLDEEAVLKCESTYSFSVGGKCLLANNTVKLHKKKKFEDCWALKLYNTNQNVKQTENPLAI